MCFHDAGGIHEVSVKEEVYAKLWKMCNLNEFSISFHMNCQNVNQTGNENDRKWTESGATVAP